MDKFEIKAMSNFSTHEKLLYNLMLEIRELRKDISMLKNNELPKIETEKKENKVKHICKTCKKEYDNFGAYMRCAKEHKKEGKKK